MASTSDLSARTAPARARCCVSSRASSLRTRGGSRCWRATRFAYLPQRGEVDGEATILQLIPKRVSDLDALEAAIRELEQRMRGSDAAEPERVMEEHAIVSINDRYMRRDRALGEARMLWEIGGEESVSVPMTLGV